MVQPYHTRCVYNKLMTKFVLSVNQGYETPVVGLIETYEMVTIGWSSKSHDYHARRKARQKLRW